MTATLNDLVTILDTHLTGWSKEGPYKTGRAESEEYRQTQVVWTAAGRQVVYTQTYAGGWSIHVRCEGGEVLTSSDVATPDAAVGLVRLVLGGDR